MNGKDHHKNLSITQTIRYTNFLSLAGLSQYPAASLPTSQCFSTSTLVTLCLRQEEKSVNLKQHSSSPSRVAQWYLM